MEATRIKSGVRRIVILGHRGFIGGNLYRFVQQRSPEVEVIGKGFPEVDLTRIEQVELLAEFFDLNTAVVVCAAIKKQLGDNIEAFSSNMQIAINLCRVLAKKPAKRVIFFSSAAVYGEEIQNTSISEATPPQPTSYYGLAKFTSEVLLHKAVALNGGSSLVCLRPPLIYGPGDQGGYGPTGFIKAALAHEPIVLWGDGSEKREFIYVGDVAKIVDALIHHSYEGVLNVVSGRSYTYQDVLDIVRGLTSGDLSFSSRPRSKGKADHGFDNAKLRQLLPGMEFTTLEAGVGLSYAAFAKSKPC